jgi:predicted nucleotidyltransferase
MPEMNDIRAFTRRLADEFRPQRIILFGSHANGQKHPGSDVDLLIELSYSGNSLRVAERILRRLGSTLPVDLVVCSPRELRKRLAEHDWFLMDIVEKGIVLYERRDA